MDVKKAFRMMTAVLCCLCMLVGVVALPARANGADSSQIQTEIDELKKQEEALLKRFAELENKLSVNTVQLVDAVEQKNLLDQQIVLLHEQINNTNEQIMAYGQMIADRQEELDGFLAQQQVLVQKHKDRIRAMEERGKLSYWNILFRASSFTDLLDRLSMIQEIAAADQRNLSDLRATSAKVNAMQKEQQSERAALEQSRQQLLQAQEDLEQKRMESDALLQGLVAKGKEFELLLDESEKKQDELMEQLAQKKSEYNDAAYQEWLASGKDGSAFTDDGRWIAPVPYYTLTSPFGLRYHPILKIWRMHNGVDMACAANTPIYAARGGLVITAAYQADGAGNYVQIDHGDGYRTIYMHMIRYIVQEGQYVAPGQVIGYVGSTGLSEGNHLHYGISYDGVYINPMHFVS